MTNQTDVSRLIERGVIWFVTGMVALGLGVPFARATITDAPWIVFSEDFDNNNNGWSNISPASNNATIGTDPGPTSEGVWYPSVDSDNTDVDSLLFPLPISVDLSKGFFDAYMRVRVDDIDNQDSNRFYMTVHEDGTDRFGTLNVRPGAATQLIYRNASGAGTTTDITGFAFANTTDFVDFRLRVIDNNDGSMTLEGYKKESTDSDFVFLGSAANADLNNNGVFVAMTIFNRNASGGSNRAYFDSVALSQVPEPSTIFLLVSGATFLWWYPRRWRR